MKRRLFPLILAFSLVLLNGGPGFCEDAGAESEVQWLWGEVFSVNPQNGEIAVRFLDYETDSEKETLVKIDDKTTYENVNSILEIKPLDTLSIDYTVGPDGTYIAKNISLEKPETTPEPQEPPQANPPKEP